jgi:hypothetical protein
MNVGTGTRWAMLPGTLRMRAGPADTVQECLLEISLRLDAILPRLLADADIPVVIHAGHYPRKIVTDGPAPCAPGR